jgi:hypothetical protein
MLQDSLFAFHFKLCPFPKRVSSFFKLETKHLKLGEKLPQPQNAAGQPTHYENTQLYLSVKCCCVEKEFALLLVGENSFLSLLIGLCFCFQVFVFAA